MMHVDPAEPADLSLVQAAYDRGRGTQRAQGTTIWPEFADAAILAEITGGRLLRVRDGEAIAGVFSVEYEDPAIWGSDERGAHVYLHRIARAPAYDGSGIFTAIVRWALADCRARRREGLRMDTWASNAALIAYYERFGFRRVRDRRIAADPRLPAHYHGIELALLERGLGDAPEPAHPRGA